MASHAANYALLDLALDSLYSIGIGDHPRDRHGLLSSHMVELKQNRVSFVALKTAGVLQHLVDRLCNLSSTLPCSTLRLVLVLPVSPIALSARFAAILAGRLEAIRSASVLVETRRPTTTLTARTPLRLRHD
jgi:hypothetical protein